MHLTFIKPNIHNELSTFIQTYLYEALIGSEQIRKKALRRRELIFG